MGTARGFATSWCGPKGGIRGDAGLNLGRLVLLEESRVQPQQVREHCLADIGADPLANPGNEVEAGKCACRQQHHQYGNTEAEQER